MSRRQKSSKSGCFYWQSFYVKTDEFDSKLNVFENNFDIFSHPTKINEIIDQKYVFEDATA